MVQLSGYKRLFISISNREKRKKPEATIDQSNSEIKSAIVLTLGLRVGTSVTGLDVVGATIGEVDGMSVIGFWVGGSYHIVRSRWEDVVLYVIGVGKSG